MRLGGTYRPNAVRRGGCRTNYAPPAPPAPVVDTGVPPADDGVVAMNIGESNIQPTLPRASPKLVNPLRFPRPQLERARPKRVKRLNRRKL